MDTELTGHENDFFGLKIDNLTSAKELYKALETIIPDHITTNDLHFLCLGTDRSTGDAFGPLVGSHLKERGFENVTGTIDDPCHGANLKDKVNEIPNTKYIVAVDSCLGRPGSVGTMQVVKGSIKPGTGVGKNLGEYGDASIIGIVNVSGFMEYFVLQSTRLSMVMDLAHMTSEAIQRLTHNRSAISVIPCKEA